MKQLSRRWILACVAAAFLLTLLVYKVDNQEIFGGLQAQLKQIGIQLKAENISLSPMYIGSIRLDDVEIETNAFSLQADRLFIDLDLAALLTGKALPQALYIQVANIDVKQTNDEEWLRLAETESFKLKRIDISQSEIHFSEHHITLEKVNLDIRDIGRNKNPRIELRAHIGEGRLDAHGYLRLKRGEITRGFGRLRVHDIPLAFVNHSTTLETLNGSITTHLNKDKSWQSFGHIALQKASKDKLEFRGKLTGNKQQLFHIDDMVLNIKQAGALQFSGDCITLDSCLINLNSKELKLSPIMELIDSETKLNERIKGSYLQSVNIQSTWKNKTLSSLGNISWQELTYALPNPQGEAHFDATKLVFSGLERNKHGSWNLEQANIINNQHIALSVNKAHYFQDEWELPVLINDSDLWLPISNVILNTNPDSPIINGEGSITGYANIQGNKNIITSTSFELDAGKSEIHWQKFLKPKNVKFKIHGTTSRQTTEQTQQADISIELAEAFTKIIIRQNSLGLEELTADFNQIKKSGITLPVDAHGYISGNATLNSDLTDVLSANLDLIDFGINEHHLNGQVNKKKNRWQIQNLSWLYNKNRAYISTDKKGGVNITANKLDTKGLSFIQLSPFTLQGKLITKALVLPFGIIKDVSSNYKAEPKIMTLKQFKGTFYEGSLRSKAIKISQQGDIINFKGNMQAGGIRLKDWRWLNKKFQTIIKGNLYSTLNISADFNKELKLSAWQAKGDVLVYNGHWLLDNESIKADKLGISFKKRKQFVAKFEVSHNKQSGVGEITIDESAQTSGYLNFTKKAYKFSEKWPVLSYQ